MIFSVFEFGLRSEKDNKFLEFVLKTQQQIGENLKGK